ncbi:MAG: hypothetical protein WDA65_03475 [Christensenellales bacterium]
MEDKTIKLLYINSEVNALISINQAPAGETGLGAVTQPIAANSTFFITMLPLENAKNFVYFPYTRKISIASKGTVFDNDGLIDLCVWPENIVELNLYPQAVYKNEDAELCPVMLSPYDFYVGGERHAAFIYNEAYSSFAVEHAATSRLKFIAPLPFKVKSAEIDFYRIGELPVLCASGKTEDDNNYLYTAHVLPSFQTDICTVCVRHSVENDGIYVIKDGRFHQIKTRWEQSGQALAPAISELGWYTCERRIAQEPAQICTALLEAVQSNAQSIAMECLTPSLAEGLAFSDLKEFFGDFDSIAQTLSPACGQGGIALKYTAGDNLFFAREFCIDTKKTDSGLLIDNIREP